eukprot:TRINITY_DN1166_c0_g1_i2.p1 TRINITY_DN1166_c0_g1~~TRINITY_DN1166_c0_g1_i2.p1  ORF type:complete len:116 (-),score=26.09 TRINITY_DN1166_c0_g1_i2:84-431(-)
MSGGNTHCPFCSKRVYFAERHFAEGKDWHISCYKQKEKEEQARSPRVFSISEQMFCNPTDMPTHTGSSMPAEKDSERGPLYAPPPRKPMATEASCGGCGAKVAGMKFCSGCGTKV